MDSITFWVRGLPIGKQRPRFNSETRTTYTPQKTLVWEKEIKNAFEDLGKEAIPKGIPIRISVLAKYEPPKSWSKKRKTAVLLNNAPKVSKPDCDNVLKAVLDALNGVAYADDAQICACFVSKRYDHCTGLEITISEAQ